MTRNYIETTGSNLKHIKCGLIYQIVTKDGRKRSMKFVGISVNKTMVASGGFFMNFLTKNKTLEQIWFKDIEGIYYAKRT